MNWAFCVTSISYQLIITNYNTLVDARLQRFDKQVYLGNIIAMIIRRAYVVGNIMVCLLSDYIFDTLAPIDNIDHLSRNIC